MKTFGKHRARHDILTACVVIAACLPFGIVGGIGLNRAQTGKGLSIGFLLLSVLGVIGAAWITIVGRRFAVDLNDEYVEYREPFRRQRINAKSLTSATVGVDDDLILQGKDGRLVIPPTVFADSEELSEFKSMLRQIVGPNCKVAFTGLVWNG